MISDRRRPVIIAIQEILRASTDAAHPMRYAALSQALEERYGLTPTRKSIAGCISVLQEMGVPLVFDRGWYYAHEFTPAELNMLIDSVLSAGQISELQRLEMMEKLSRLGGDCYAASAAVENGRLANRNFLGNLELLHAAIHTKHQVSFHYTDYGMDKQLHYRLNEKGRPKPYKVNPYQIAVTNGRYYLICNVDKYDSLCHFRVERIVDIRALKSRVKPVSRLEGGGPGNIQRYLASHPFMYAGETRKYTIRVKKKWLNEVLDTFGMEAELGHETADTFEARVICDEASMGFWLKKYAGDAELIGEKQA